MSYHEYKKMKPVITFKDFNKDNNRTRAEFYEEYHDKQGYDYTIDDLKKRLGFDNPTINKLIKPHVPYVLMSNSYRNIEKGIFPFPEKTFFQTGALVNFLKNQSTFVQRTRLVDISRLSIDRGYKKDYAKILKDLFIRHITINLVGDELTPHIKTSFFKNIAEICPEFNSILLKYAWIVSGNRSRISLIINGEGLSHRVKYPYEEVEPYNFLQIGELIRQKKVEADHPVQRLRFGFKYGYINIRFNRTVFFGMPFAINSFFFDPLGDVQPVKIDTNLDNIAKQKIANEMKAQIAEHIQKTHAQLVIPAVYSDDDLLNTDLSRVNTHTFENKLPNLASFQQLIDNVKTPSRGDYEEL